MLIHDSEDEKTHQISHHQLFYESNASSFLIYSAHNHCLNKNTKKFQFFVRIIRVVCNILAFMETAKCKNSNFPTHMSVIVQLQSLM